MGFDISKHCFTFVTAKEPPMWQWVILEIQQYGKQSTLIGAGVRGISSANFGYATKSRPSDQGASFFCKMGIENQSDLKRFIYGDTVIFSCVRDEHGNIIACPPTDTCGRLLDIKVLQSIIKACEEDLAKHNAEERELHNLRIEKKRWEENRSVKKDRAKLVRENIGCQVYLIEDTIRSLYKIGISVCAKNRFKAMKTSNPGIKLRSFYSGVQGDEDKLHSHFKALGKHIDGEWFNLDGHDLVFFQSYFVEKNLPF